MSTDHPSNDPANLHHVDQQPPAAPPPNDQRAGDEVLSLLDSLGGQLEALRRHKSEHQTQLLEVARRQAELRAQEDALRQREAEIAAKLEQSTTLEHRLEAARAELTAQGETLSRQAGELESRQRELESRLAEAERRERELGDRERSLGEAARAAQERENQELNQARAALQQTEQALGEVRTQLDARTAELGALRAEADRARSESAQSKAALDAVAEKLHDTAQKAADSETLRREHAAEIEKYDTAIGALKSRLDASEARARALDDELSLARQQIEQGGTVDVEQAATVALRRERLRIYKALLQQQARKIAQAKKVLEKKQQEIGKTAGAKVEQESVKLIELKKQLGAERLEVAKLKRSYEAKVARGRAMVGVTCFFLTFAAIVIASWFVAGKIATPVYLASAAVGINKNDLDNEASQIGTWREYMDELVNDPQMVDIAAQRLSARGYKEVGTPSDLRAFIASSMDIADRAPGEIGITIKGKGDDRTARLLDTFTQAMVGYANDTRDLRADRATTMIVQAARAEGQPVEDPRLALAGMIAGAASAVALFIGVLLWRSLNHREDDQPQLAFDDAMMGLAPSEGEPAPVPAMAAAAPSAPGKPGMANKRPV